MFTPWSIYHKFTVLINNCLIISTLVSITQIHEAKTRERTCGVHFEVDELATRQRDHHLTLVDGTLDDLLLGRRAPLVDALVGADVADALRVDLDEGVLAELRAAECGHCAQEARVRHLLHRFADAQHQGGIQEGDDDVRVELI